MLRDGHINLAIRLAASNFCGVTNQLQDIGPASNSIHNVDEIAGVELDVVRHDVGLANRLSVDRGAARLRERVDRGNEVSDLLGVHRIADIPNPDACVEV